MQSQAGEFAERVWRLLVSGERARSSALGTSVASSLGVVVAIITAMVVAGLVNGTSSSAYVNPKGEPTDRSRQLQARFDALYARFNGTVSQRNSSGVLQAWKLNGAMDTCMENEGFPEWDWSRTRNHAPRTNALATSEFLAAPLAHSYSKALRDTATGIKAEKGLRTEILSPEEDDAVGRCLNRTENVSDRVASQYSTPEMASNLRERWWSLLRDVDEKFGDARKYNECFAGRKSVLGLPEDLVGNSWQRKLELAVPSEQDIPLQHDTSSSEAWDSFVSLEEAIERADWECRRDIYSAHLSDVEEAIAAFESENAGEISLAEDQWEQIDARAAKLGYYGQAGSLD